MTCVNSVTVYPSSVILKVGEWYYGAYTQLCPIDADCTEVVWSSSNTNVASVNASNGYIFAKSAGTAKIYATATDGSGASDYCTVTVKQTVPVSSITLSRSSLSLEKEDCYSLTATVSPSNATNKTLSWRSSNQSVATVGGGNVYAHANGTTTITATATDGSGVSASCTVTVTSDILATSVTVTPSSTTMTKGSAEYLYAMVCPTNATNRTVSWSSTNTSVATVNPNSGLVTAQGGGSATIYATAQDGSGHRDGCAVTVIVPVTDVVISQTSVALNAGETADLTATVYPSNATNKTLVWMSTDPTVACVDYDTGRVYARGSGTAFITATSAGGEASDCVAVTVVKPTVTYEKDGDYHQIIFNETGKVWRCIEHDMVQNETYRNDNTLIQRMNYNTFKDYDASSPTNWPLVEYTADEIKLLYAIDPHGVARYVEKYAQAQYSGEENGGLKSILQFKDEIFLLLFKRDPLYFERTSQDVWRIAQNVNENSNFRKLLSESEAIFGFHPIHDELTKGAVVETIFSFVELAVSVVLMLTGLAPVVSDVASTTIDLVKLAVFKLLGMDEDFLREVKTQGEDKLKEKVLDFFDDQEDSIVHNIADDIEGYLEIIEEYVDLMNALDDWAKSMSDAPYYLKLGIYQYIHEIPYDIIVKFSDGRTCRMQDIQEALRKV